MLLFDSYLYRVGHIRICIREFLFVWHCTTLLICIRICLFYLFQFSINKKKLQKKHANGKFVYYKVKFRNLCLFKLPTAQYSKLHHEEQILFVHMLRI